MADNTNYRFNFNKKVIAKLKRYNANTAYGTTNLSIANSNAFTIDYANVSGILKNFILDLPNINVETLGLDSGNLNLTFSSNVSTNYFVGNVRHVNESNANVVNYYNLLCYTSNFSQITSTIHLKDYF